eukprot:scaffold869_cov105-Isochrysis_galbana.AAC.8
MGRLGRSPRPQSERRTTRPAWPSARARAAAPPSSEPGARPRPRPPPWRPSARHRPRRLMLRRRRRGRLAHLKARRSRSGASPRAKPLHHHAPLPRHSPPRRRRLQADRAAQSRSSEECRRRRHWLPQPTGETLATAPAVPAAAAGGASSEWLGGRTPRSRPRWLQLQCNGRREAPASAVGLRRRSRRSAAARAVRQGWARENRASVGSASGGPPRRTQQPMPRRAAHPNRGPRRRMVHRLCRWCCGRAVARRA